MMAFVVKAVYFAAAVLFIVGLKQMSSPRTARRGIVWAGVGMVAATLVTFLHPAVLPHNAAGWTNLFLIILAIGVGGGLAWVTGKKVAMTGMPQMVALYNGMGGGAAGAIGAVELFEAASGTELPFSVVVLALAGALIGAVSFSGSLVAFAKLQGWMDKAFHFPKQQMVNLLVFGLTVAVGIVLLFQLPPSLIVLFFVLALAFGVMMTLPIGGADMPVVISLYNALTGLAVAFEGFVLQNEAMIIAGTVVGAAGTLLTQLMARAMNRPIASVLFRQFGGGGESAGVEGEMKPIEASDAAVMMAYADRVVIIPGYGLAVAQAQHKIWELAEQLRKRGVKVKFAIHPVAGRMPGHMNVLLAEAGVPYDLIEDMEDINPELANTDVALVIGANDVVNPVARTDPNSPIYGMPILDADKARNVIVIKRGKGTGFAGIENALFFDDTTRMLFGDGQDMAGKLVGAVKSA